MRILFVHQNFPGQFVHLAPALQQRGHEVLALTAASNTRQLPVGAARYAFEQRDFSTARMAKVYAEMTYRGEVAAAAAVDLRDRHGFMPDVVFGTPGWGETLFLKEVWPAARHLLYAEFFYGPHTGLQTFDPEFMQDDLRSRILLTARQAHLLLALHTSGKLLAPMHWQAQSFPSSVQDRMTVIHDGIDTTRVTPSAAAQAAIPGTALQFKSGDEVLTFINRNLEPHRGFHIFMRALPQVLAARPKAQVVIVGGEGVSYSQAPAGGKTWKQVLLAEVGHRLDLSRVHFVGQVPYTVFVDLMRVSRVHAYLTYPFVLSWSMLEAMSAGALIVGSRTAPVEEVIEDGVNGRLVDFFDTAAWADTLIECLAEPQRFSALRQAARRTICDRYDLRSVCLPRMIEFVETV